MIADLTDSIEKLACLVHNVEIVMDSKKGLIPPEISAQIYASQQRAHFFAIVSIF